MIQINLRLKKLFKILIRIHLWLNCAVNSQFRMTFLGIQLNCWLGMTVFGLSTQVPTSYDLFWAFTQVPANKLIRISSWLKQCLGDLNRFSSWLKWIPRCWFRSTRLTRNSGVPRHFDKSKTPSSLTFCSFFLFMGLSWALTSAVTISNRCDLRFLSYSLGQCSEVSLQKSFRSQNWDIYSTKKSKQITWINWQWIKEFNYDIYFVTLNDLDHVTLKSFLWSVWPGAHLWFLIFTPQNTSLWFAFQGKK